MNPCRCCGQEAYSGSMGGRNLCIWCDTGGTRPADVRSYMPDPQKPIPSNHAIENPEERYRRFEKRFVEAERQRDVLAAAIRAFVADEHKWTPVVQALRAALREAGLEA